MKKLTVVIKGAGEMATDIACRLHMAGVKNIVMLEIPQPLAVRRTVAFCESIHHGEVEVEGIKGVFAEDLNELPRLWDKKQIRVSRTLVRKFTLRSNQLSIDDKTMRLRILPLANREANK